VLDGADVLVDAALRVGDDVLELAQAFEDFRAGRLGSIPADQAR
jgi:hypothetical protein